MISSGKYKDVSALVLNTGKLIASVLPENGGKLVSLVDTATGTELLAQAPGEAYLPIGMDSSYVQGECSAFDDMFPTIDPQGDGYPDHGEVCRVKHQWNIHGDTLSLTYRSVLLPYRYEKHFSALADGSLAVDYRIANLSDAPLPCLWAGHIMLAASEGAEVVLPYEQGDGIEICFCENGRLIPGQRTDFRRELAVQAPFKPDGATYKFYFTQPAAEGKITYRNSREGLDVTVRYDADVLPYVGVWMNNGTFKGMYNAAVEMCTAPFDAPAKAEAKGYRSVLPAGGVLSFRLTFSAETMPASV